ncbi:MAG: hypothetical protein LUG86_00240 [Oscillospiraceae bacterium]|nr:hypothetical protein [Oscillospiraceae bacterium]
MLTINELYTSLFAKLDSIAARYANVGKQVILAGEQDEITKQKRIDNLQEQLKRIEEYEEKVDYFRHIAEKHLTSKNILTITPRELNFNRLRNWAMMIDPEGTDDPYAQRIYIQAKCNEMFLKLKKEEFEKTLAELTSGEVKLDDQEQKAIDALKNQLVNECLMVLESQEFEQFSHLVASHHSGHTDSSSLQRVVTASDEAYAAGIGQYAKSFPIIEELKYLAKAKLGEYYDVKGSRVLLPLEHSLQSEVVLSVGCSPAKEKKLYRGIQNYILDIASQSPIGSRKVCLLDAVHFNNTALGALRPLEESILIEPIPKSAEQIADALRQIVSGFSDIDETLEFVDSVQEYNSQVKPEERIVRTILVLIGYPTSFSSEAKDLIRRILLNYERYGITLILADTQFSASRDDSRDDVSSDVGSGLFRIQMTKQNEVVRQDDGTNHFFRWYELRQELSDSFVSEVRSYDNSQNTLGTEYVRRVDMENAPNYERGRKSIVLPYGVDGKDGVNSISFDNENFACYLMGASGSGKSTLIHTLITGILRDYHPDDVELWLADFKMSEFAQYMDPMPPHVKYILLDESPELVYDLLDQLTEKMMERQRFFMKHRDMKKVENVPKDTYMPIIFVILDEFSIMSQAVADSETYKLRLQNLLAKGRALGIKFIFSSQTFTSGIRGLTTTAKDQIQTRIAMKNSYSEIDETLQLSSTMKTDQVRNWMNALPPHYALAKYRDGENVYVKKLQVMYFKGNGEEALQPQRKLIERIRRMRPVDISEYNPDDVSTYVDKHPVIVDGNSYKAFNTARIMAGIAEYRRENASDIVEGDTILALGSPRRMVSVKYATVSNESRENILMISRNSELACGMSVVMTTMELFSEQGSTVHVWAYSKNSMFKAYKDSHFARFDVREGMEDVCNAISEMKEKIISRVTSSELIVLLGMDQICSDFELVEPEKLKQDAAVKAAVGDLSSVTAKTEEELQQVAEVDDAQREFEEMYHIDELEEQWLAEDRSVEYMTAEIERLHQEYCRKTGRVTAAEESEELPEVSQEKSDSEPEKPGVYNALEDFRYIIKQGSRLGYHFMICLNDLSDLRSSGLQAELFRHKIAFQISADDSRMLFSSKAASGLPEHICQYTDSLEQYSLRPFIHNGISWDGWDIDEKGEAVN